MYLADELQQCRQRSNDPVSDYYHRKCNLLQETDMNDEQMVNSILIGLKDDIRIKFFYDTSVRLFMSMLHRQPLKFEDKRRRERYQPQNRSRDMTTNSGYDFQRHG